MHIPLLFLCISVSLASGVSLSGTSINIYSAHSTVGTSTRWGCHTPAMPLLRRVPLFHRIANSLTAQQAHEHAVPVADIESVKKQIVSHEMQEAEIAKKYGIPGNADSAAILQTVKDISWNSMDPQYSPDEFKRDAEALDALLKLRCRLAQLQEQTLPGPIPNSSEQTPKPTDLEVGRCIFRFLSERLMDIVCSSLSLRARWTHIGPGALL